jgi:hypothetical protein
MAAQETKKTQSKKEIKAESKKVSKKESAVLPESAYDDPEKRTMSSRESARDQMDKDVLAFLSKGGEVRDVETGVMGDPPRKPVSNYGSRPI